MSLSPIAMPGTHEQFLAFLEKTEGKEGQGQKVLDIGAGHGAFSQQLHRMGYEVSACDLMPDLFQFEEIECKRVDVTQEFPYPDGHFDMLIAIEVMEHFNGQDHFFREACRILKKGGRLFITTPNILSLKSRMRFLLGGFYYSFGPLDHSLHDGMQHVSALTFDQFNYWATKNGFGPAKLDTDKLQKSSRWLSFLIPFQWLYLKWKGVKPLHNQRKLLYGRILFLTFRKK